MTTEEQYKEALAIVDQYRKQLSFSAVNDSSKIDVYEWVKAEMMATTDITLDEFEEVLRMWLSIKKKELNIAEFEKNYR